MYYVNSIKIVYKYLFLIALFFTIPASIVFSESLWDPNSTGRYGMELNIDTGDVLIVTIDNETSLSFSSSQIDSQSIDISFSGGETGDLLSFLPQIETTQNFSTESEEEISFSTRIPVLITGQSQNGLYQLQGSRTFAVSTRSEVINVSGFVHPSQINPDRTIGFNAILDARLSFQTAFDTQTNVIDLEDIDFPEYVTEEDLPEEEGETQQDETAEAETVSEEDAQAAETPTQEEAPAQEAGTQEEDEEETQETPQLSEERRRELLVQYVNRFLSIIFSNGE
ncbi:MAG: flagellar basal body L-ring protein FlgH [Spirochaetia bacterium]